jgi:hypothetical protein
VQGALTGLTKGQWSSSSKKTHEECDLREKQSLDWWAVATLKVHEFATQVVRYIAEERKSVLLLVWNFADLEEREEFQVVVCHQAAVD